jgi:hypothetical protein
MLTNSTDATTASAAAIMCAAIGCPKPWVSRGLCRAHYRRAQRSGTLPPLAPKHRLSQINPTAKTAVCELCGPTPIRYRPGRASECMSLVKAERRGRVGRYRWAEWRIRRARNLRQFNLTLDGYADLLADQGGVCAICRKAPQAKPLCVDHCHTTGAIRGLLCGPCNTALGMLGDDPDRVDSAAAYLRTNPA